MSSTPLRLRGAHALRWDSSASSPPAASGLPVAVSSSPGVPGLCGRAPVARRRRRAPARPGRPRAAGRTARGSRSRVAVLLVSGSGCAPGTVGSCSLASQSRRDSSIRSPTRSESSSSCPPRAPAPRPFRRAPRRPSTGRVRKRRTRRTRARQPTDRPGASSVPAAEPSGPASRAPAPAPELAAVLDDLDPRRAQGLARAQREVARAAAVGPPPRARSGRSSPSGGSQGPARAAPATRRCRGSAPTPRRHVAAARAPRRRPARRRAAGCPRANTPGREVRSPASTAGPARERVELEPGQHRELVVGDPVGAEHDRVAGDLAAPAAVEVGQLDLLHPLAAADRAHPRARPDRHPVAGRAPSRKAASDWWRAKLGRQRHACARRRGRAS